MKICLYLRPEGVIIKEQKKRWEWRPAPGTGYSVCDAYQILTSQDTVTIEAAGDLIWHKQVPLKVSILAWRLLRDRLPTKTNLVAQDILSPDLAQCVKVVVVPSLPNICSFHAAPSVLYGL
jgi:hypothetical protein